MYGIAELGLISATENNLSIEVQDHGWHIPGYGILTETRDEAKVF